MPWRSSYDVFMSPGPLPSRPIASHAASWRPARPSRYGWAAALLALLPFAAVLVDRDLEIPTGGDFYLELRDVLPWFWLLAVACCFTAFYVRDRRHRAPVSRGRALGVLGASVLALLLVWPFELRLRLPMPQAADTPFGPARQVVGTGPVIDVLGIALPAWRGLLDEWTGLPGTESYALFPQEQIYAGQRYLEGSVALSAFPAQLTCPGRESSQWLFLRRSVFHAHYGDPRRGKDLLDRLRAAAERCLPGLQPPPWFLPEAGDEERMTVFGAKVLPAAASSITVQWFELAAAQGKVGQILTEPWAPQRYTAYGRYLLYASVGEAAADVLPVSARASAHRPAPPASGVVGADATIPPPRPVAESGDAPLAAPSAAHPSWLDAAGRALSVPFQPGWAGGWRAEDYAYAVRMCNLGYARFLHARGLRPDPTLPQVLAQALREPASTLGLSQYGDAPTPALYRMPQSRLHQCRALLAWLQPPDPARHPPRVTP